MRYRILLFALLAITIAGSATAQTNLGIVGGALFPFGDLKDTSDISPYVGARYEVQDVNALGQVATVSYLIYGGYAFLLTSSELEAVTDENGGYFDIGLGARVHSKSNGLFAGVGAGYVNYNPAGATSSSNGLGVMVGLGLATKMTSFKLELEGRGNVGFMEGSQTITSIMVLLGIGFPF